MVAALMALLTLSIGVVAGAQTQDPQTGEVTCPEGQVPVYGEGGGAFCDTPEQQEAAPGAQPEAQSPIPPGPARCEGIIVQAEFEACVAQGGPIEPSEAPIEEPVAPASQYSTEDAAPSGTLPDTGGLPLTLIAGAMLVSAGFLIRKR